MGAKTGEKNKEGIEKTAKKLRILRENSEKKEREDCEGIKTK